MQESHGPRTHPGQSVTPGTWCKVSVQVIIRAALVPQEHNGKHLVLDCSNINAGVWTPSCPAMPCCPPWCQGLPMPRHTQAGGSPAGALVGACPRQCLGGVNSRPNDHGDEQSTGAPVRWILNTMGPFDQQWYDRASLWPRMMLRDTVMPSLTSHFSFHHLKWESYLQKTAKHMILWLVPLKSLQKWAPPLHRAVRDSTDWTLQAVKAKARGSWCSSTAGHLQSSPHIQ